jgi:hypothetical protein
MQLHAEEHERPQQDRQDGRHDGLHLAEMREVVMRLATTTPTTR